MFSDSSKPVFRKISSPSGREGGYFKPIAHTRPMFKSADAFLFLVYPSRRCHPYPVSLPVEQCSRLLQHLCVHLLLSQAICKGGRVCMNLIDDAVFSILISRTRSSTVRIPFCLVSRLTMPQISCRKKKDVGDGTRYVRDAILPKGPTSGSTRRLMRKFQCRYKDGRRMENSR